MPQLHLLELVPPDMASQPDAHALCAVRRERAMIHVAKKWKFWAVVLAFLASRLSLQAQTPAPAPPSQSSPPAEVTTKVPLATLPVLTGPPGLSGPPSLSSQGPAILTQTYEDSNGPL